MQELNLSQEKLLKNLSECKMSIQAGHDLLKQIAETCCMPERSRGMKLAFDYLDEALLEVARTEQGADRLTRCQELITQCGGVIGSLNVSCCTETREPLYKSLFQHLQNAYVRTLSATGQEH